MDHIKSVPLSVDLDRLYCVWAQAKQNDRSQRCARSNKDFVFYSKESSKPRNTTTRWPLSSLLSFWTRPTLYRVSITNPPSGGSGRINLGSNQLPMCNAMWHMPYRRFLPPTRPLVAVEELILVASSSLCAMLCDIYLIEDFYLQSALWWQWKCYCIT